MPSPQHPRLFTSMLRPGFPVEINGTVLNATDLTIASSHDDYAPAGSLQVHLTFDAEYAAEPPEETPEQREAAELAAITAEWQAVRDRYAGLPAVQSALDLHHPRRPFVLVQCDLCKAPNGVPDADYVWPCPTYTALAAEPESTDCCAAECGPVELGEAVAVETPEDGIRSQYGVTFQPGEIAAVRAAADAAGKSTTAYLHDVAVTASAPVAVTIHFNGPPPGDAINKQLLAEYRAYPGLLRH